MEYYVQVMKPRASGQPKQVNWWTNKADAVGETPSTPTPIAISLVTRYCGGSSGTRDAQPGCDFRANNP
jgi:hypothetical protein